MKRPPPGWVGLALAVAALVGLSAWSLRYFGRYQPLADLMAGQDGLGPVGLRVNGADVTGRVAGRRRWRVSARQITFSLDQRQVSVDGLHHGVLFDARERPVALLSAGSVLYQSLVPVFGGGPQGYLQVGGGLRARLLGRYGPVVSTAGLSWDPARSLVSSPGPVTAQFPPGAGAVGGVRLVADTVQWDARRDVLQSPGHVQVVFAGGAGAATGDAVSVDLHTGDLTLRRLHGTFALPREVQQAMALKPSRPAPLLLAGLVLASVPGGAAPAVPAAPPLPVAPAPSASPAPAHYVVYDAGASTYLNAPHVVQMSKGVKFNQDDAYLVTQAAVVNLDDEEHALNADSRAPVHLWDSQNDLTGQHGYVDFTKHIATIKDNITLVVKPGAQNAGAPAGSLKSKFKDPATMTCALMTYDYRRKYGTVPGPLTVRQKDRVLTADHGVYDGNAQIVTLTGHVHGYNGQGKIDSPEVLFGIKEGDEVIRIDHHVHGIFKQAPDDSTGDAPPLPPDPKAYDTFKNGGAAADAPLTPPSPGGSPPAPNSGATAPGGATAPDGATAPSGGAGTAPAPDTPAAPPTSSPTPPTPPELGAGGRAGAASPLASPPK